MSSEGSAKGGVGRGLPLEVGAAVGQLDQLGSTAQVGALQGTATLESLDATLSFRWQFFLESILSHRLSNFRTSLFRAGRKQGEIHVCKRGIFT